ncbi:hypothetical protein ACWEKT_27975 [Nocardia takedensis]
MGSRARFLRGAVAAIAVATICSGAGAASAQPEGFPPLPGLDAVPSRTTLAVRTPFGVGWGTANQEEVRGALSMAKLYLADYALRHGDGSEEDIALSERMIRFSDNAAADTIEAKYPGAIAAVATEYGLEQTSTTGAWSTSLTSAADLADFLSAKQTSDPTSPILRWMTEAAPVAADGTAQDWGTARLPGVRGTKWGWSDLPPQEVASASFGPGFTVAAITLGTPQDQTTDVLEAMIEASLAVPFP